MAKHVAQSERLLLEPLTVEDHLEAYHILNTEERVIKWSSQSGLRNTIEDSKASLISRQPSEEKPWAEMYAIMLRSSTTNEKAKFIGSMGVVRVSEDGRAAEVGYGIMPDQWGNGYAPEALRLLVDFYWKSERKVPKDELIAGTEPTNLPSQRVLEKAGFKRGETIEKAFQAPNRVTGEMEWRDAIEWHLGRPKV